MTTEPNAPQGSLEPIPTVPAYPPAGTSSAGTQGESAPSGESGSLAGGGGADTTPRTAPAWWFKIDALLLVLLLVLSFLLASFAAVNSDLWMNLAIGKRISEGEFTFGIDPFSWATQAREGKAAPYWVHHGWLSSWILYQGFISMGGPLPAHPDLARHVAGGGGLVLIKALLVVATVVLLSRVGWKESNRWFLLICLTMAVLAISQRLLLHSTIFSFLFLALTLLLLDRAGVFTSNAPGAKPAQPLGLWILPPLFALWANLDAWFILGLVLVALCWLATGLRQWFHTPKTVSGGTLGLVLALSVLACLFNPHHVHVFQLPPELAYLLLSLRLPLPDSLAGGGRTLHILKQSDPDYIWTMSSVAPRYWKNQGYGLNIAGLAFYPLLVMGLAAFTLSAMTRHQPGAPTFHPARFLVWLIFAMMALSLYRMIAFFVIVAAPLTAMTLGEFMHWQHSQTEQRVGQRERGMHLARLISVPFLLMLLLFAYPGWISSTTDLYKHNPRHVAWEVRPDASLLKTVATLQRLQRQGECDHVFNFSFDLPNYCAWYAPEVRCFIDTRFALFPDHALAFTRARQSLLDRRKPEADWQDLFVQNGVDQAVLAHFIDPRLLVEMVTNREYLIGSHLRWWLDARQWRQRYGDNRNMVFSWAGLNRSWPVNTALQDWNRRAFGVVPPEERPPPAGTRQPAAPELWQWYVRGTGPQPPEAAASQLLNIHNHTRQQLLDQLSPCGWMFSCASLTQIQGLPGGLVLGPSLASLMGMMTTMPPRDPATAAMNILMVRTARLAVAENPSDLASQSILKDAYERLRRDQEDFWIGYRGGPHPSKIRDRLRQLQSIASWHSIVQLQPDHAEPYFHLAQYYQQHWLLDLALDAMQKSQKLLLARQSAIGAPSKEVDQFMLKYQNDIKTLERRVQLRLVKLQETSAGKNALALAEYAFNGKYTELIGEQMVDTPMGLGQKALEILSSIKVESLTQDERLRYVQLQFDLLLAMGDADTLAQYLQEEGVRQALPPLMLAHYQILAGGVLGDYDAMIKGLRELEGVLGKGATLRRSVWLASVTLLPGMQSSSAYGTTLTLSPIFHLRTMNEQYNDLFNVMTLQGIAALEAGDTQTARAVFQAIAAQAGEDLLFSDQPMARRYLELLNAQR